VWRVWPGVDHLIANLDSALESLLGESHQKSIELEGRENALPHLLYFTSAMSFSVCRMTSAFLVSSYINIQELGE
jgi:hypothetical protein